MGKYIEICEDAVRRYHIDLCDGTKCSNDWSRMHAHVKLRRVCKFKFRNSINAVFDLLHEIGHIETTLSSMRRCESEFFATVWAIKTAKEVYHLEFPKSIIKRYQEYINREWDRGKRRGGNLPPLDKFKL